MVRIVLNRHTDLCLTRAVQHGERQRRNCDSGARRACIDVVEAKGNAPEPGDDVRTCRDVVRNVVAYARGRFTVCRALSANTLRSSSAAFCEQALHRRLLPV